MIRGIRWVSTTHKKAILYLIRSYGKKAKQRYPPIQIKNSFFGQKDLIPSNPANSIDLVLRDELTKPAILGTIGKDKRYVPGLPGIVGGKVLVIDEFNNLNEFGLKALLGILENQRINRELGFSVKEPEDIVNEWTDLHVEGGHISGRINFSTIVFSMFYPRPRTNSFFEENPQQLLGLKSRFTPNFQEPDHGELMDALRGDRPFNLRDVGKSRVRMVIVKKDAYNAYLDEFSKLTEKFTSGESPILERKQIGFLSRVSSDILRFAAHDYLENYSLTRKHVEKEVLLKINDPDVIIENAKMWAESLLNQYLYEELAGNFSAYLNLRRTSPEEDTIFYARKLNVTRRTIQRWNKKISEGKSSDGIITNY